MKKKSEKAFLKLYCVICFLDVAIVYLRSSGSEKKMQQKSGIIG
jgi:hypothetical protein